MLSNPTIGQRVRLHYAPRWRDVPFISTARLHGKIGVVVVRGTGTPKNHGILIDGTAYSVPCGNLMPA